MASGYIDLPADVGGTVDLTTEVTGILPIANGGTGSATQNFVDLTTVQTVAGAKTFTGTPTAFTPTASTTAATTRFLFTGAADTTLTASTEAPNVYFNMGQTRQHSTGTLPNQRDFRISPSTHSFVGASTLTNAASLVIDGPSNGGTNATITNSSALWVPASAVTNITNSYGLNVAATTGATNNYAAVFTGGRVGIGTTAPTTTLDVNGPITSAGAMAAYYQFASTFSGGFNVYKRGTTGDETASLTSGTELGYNAFYGWDGSAYGRGAFVLTKTTEAWSGTGHGSYYSIWTTPTGSTTNAERMRIDQSGNVGIGTSAPGTLIHAAITNSTAYTPTSAALAIPANILTTIENLDTTDSTAALLSFVSRSGAAVNRSFIGNVSNTAGGSIVFGHRTGTTAYAERMRIDYLGNLGIGTSSPNANAILDVTSTTKAFMPPRMTTAQKTAIASPTAGMVVYDSTLNKLCIYTTAWETVTSI